jgi:3',5'-nucleoside bisphosphate phosphatase
MSNIDLHIHTTASDGTDSPIEVVRKAASIGLSAISVTDHDSVSGVSEAKEAGRQLGVEVIPGIEVSSDYLTENVHILGYFIDIHSPAMRPVLDWVKNERVERNEKVAAMLRRDGFDITIDELYREYPGSVIGRPHFCELLMRKGYVNSIKEGFDRYLGEGMPYYLPKRRISIAKAVETIVAAGGVPVLAHPFLYHYDEPELITLIETAKELGIRAVEVYYSLFYKEQTDWLLRMADKYGLGISGGSDYHGTRKPHISLGTGCNNNLAIPYEVLENLKKLK